MVPLALFVLLVFIFSLVSKRLEGTYVTAPIIMTVVGMLMFFFCHGSREPVFNANVFLRLAEFGLSSLHGREQN